MYANILDYLLQNQKFHPRNPKDDVKHIIKPKLVSSYPMASAVNFPCKIYVFSKFSGLHNGISSDCGLMDRVALYSYR
jgi:hypothetical protein